LEEGKYDEGGKEGRGGSPFWIAPDTSACLFFYCAHLHSRHIVAACLCLFFCLPFPLSFFLFTLWPLLFLCASLFSVTASETYPHGIRAHALPLPARPSHCSSLSACTVDPLFCFFVYPCNHPLHPFFDEIPSLPPLLACLSGSEKDSKERGRKKGRKGRGTVTDLMTFFKHQKDRQADPQPACLPIAGTSSGKIILFFVSPLSHTHTHTHTYTHTHTHTHTHTCTLAFTFRTGT